MNKHFVSTNTSSNAFSRNMSALPFAKSDATTYADATLLRDKLYGGQPQMNDYYEWRDSRWAYKTRLHDSELPCSNNCIIIRIAGCWMRLVGTGKICCFPSVDTPS